MGHPRPATVFVTEPTGFLGAELVRFLVVRGHDVFGLATRDTAPAVRELGATPVIGDLLTAGQWQDEAAADWVFHLTPYSTAPVRAIRGGSGRIARDRMLMDSNLLDAVGAGTTRRIVYAASMSCYGAAGARAVMEDEPPRPSAYGRTLLPALDRVEGYAIAGFPIVTAIPGCVYGNGSWLRECVVDPILSGRRVRQFGRTGPLVSPIHVRDCVRALVHLAELHTARGRYFVANSEPVAVGDFAATFARVAQRPLRLLRLPLATARLIAVPPLAHCLQSDAVLSNIRLRGTGFRFDYPTLEDGLRQVLGAVHE